MEPLNLMVSLSHFANTKPIIPPKTKRRAKPKASEHGARRALQWLRATAAR